MKRFLKAAALTVLLSTTVTAEPLDYYLVDGVKYDQTVLKPADHFGHDIADQPARQDLFVEYLRQVATASPRMTIETIGYSHERRPIVSFIVTSPENHANLEAIRKNHLLRSDPKTADQASGDLPVVTWINYGVHGAEASGMEAAIPTIYHLASARGAKINDTLKNSVIIITAVFNPDGHSRRAEWVTQYTSKVPSRDGNHEIHDHRWPSGRTNHYWFDLNRQWLLQTQPESQAWLTQWHKWKPEVSSDFHEMGRNSTYYFHPGVPTRKYPLIPSKGRELLYEIAGYHAEALDKGKELYFTEEGFDNFYVGKGSTYPQINGSLGILFEAGAQMGLQVNSDQGVKTFARNIRTHFRTSMSTINGAVAMRAKLHDYQRDFYETALKDAAKDKVKGYVFAAPKDPARMDMFLDLLRRHHVDAYSLAKDVKASGSTYKAGEAFIVPMEQTQYRMAKGIFGRITEFPDKVFYDVSGWTLPLAYGIPHAELKSAKGLLGEAATGLKPAVAVVDKAPYAYVMRWSDYYAPRAVNRILGAGIMARVAKTPIRFKSTKGEVALGRGAIIVSLDRQAVSDEAIHAMMQKVATEDGVSVYTATSGRTLDAGTDMGGRNTVSDLKAPKPLVVVGPGISVYDAGEVWHLLDKRMNVGVTLTRKERLSRVDWHDYTHLILVGGRGGAPLDKATTEKVKRWVKAGGTIIAQRNHALWTAKNILGTKEKKTEKAKLGRLDYADKGQKDAEHVIGGAIFESDLDITHPLGFGYGSDKVYSNRNTTIRLPVPDDAYAKVAVYTEKPLLTGYASEKRLKEIASTPMMTAQRMGRGSIVLFADNPNFRATFLGTNKLFMNALFFSKAFSGENRVRSDDMAEDMAEETQE